MMQALEFEMQADGSRPVFVLIHGLGMSGRYLMPTADCLSTHGKVFVPDLPGFGSSSKPSRALTIPELADALAEWLAAVGIESPVLIGNSLGAQVIVDFAARHHSRLAAAILVGPTIDPEARRIFIQIRRLLRDVPCEPFGLYGIAVMDYLRSGICRCLRTLSYALEDPITEKLPKIRVPVLVVRGEKDPIAPQQWVEQAAALIPDARWISIPGAAHAVNFNAAEALVTAVLEFLESGGKTIRLIDRDDSRCRSRRNSDLPPRRDLQGDGAICIDPQGGGGLGDG